MPEVGSTPPPVTSSVQQNQAPRQEPPPPPPPPRERQARVMPNQNLNVNPNLGQKIDITV